MADIQDQVVLYAGVHMAQCESRVFFPDDPKERPQFSDCPREAETTRRILHTVTKLCPTCARAWDEQNADRPGPIATVAASEGTEAEKCSIGHLGLPEKREGGEAGSNR